MDKDIKKLEPKAVWNHFAEICRIPHPSHSEALVREYLVDFAKRHELEYEVDDANNVIIRKPATKGMENRKGIILQAHVDMVPQKNSDKEFDFEKDAIEAYIDGDWVTADGTTLGADNGIGVSAALAVLEADDLKHGPIEALFTATEETGMDGAFGLKAGKLKGEILLNLDSESEGELYVGCAGGLDANITFRHRNEKAPKGFAAYRIEVKGLKGGHSGIEIVLERANANKLLVRLLKYAQDKCMALLSAIDGGSLRNAIPREAFATVLVPEAKRRAFEKAVSKFEQIFIQEFHGIEDNISMKAYPVKTPRTIIDTDTQYRLVDALQACPNGIIRMSHAMKGLVQTSTNLARVVSKGGKISIQCLLRSSVNTEKEDLGESIRSVFELAGADVKLTGSYDGWNPNMESPILKTMKESYHALFGVTPSVVAIHAGLECGIIGGAYPEMDMISFGPTICFPHSPDEKVNIESVGKFWKYICHTLENAPEKR